jgi:hypothetical protein
MKAVCVYCGSRMGNRPAYAEAARGLGKTLAERGITLVYGGGDVGLMGVIANAAMAAGGQVIGVIPQALVDKEVGHHAVSELIVVPDMHQRKLKMATLADAFIALPGGIGTLEELFETFTWLQLGFHQKPVGLLDVEGYFGHLTTFLDRMVEENFLRADQLAMLHRNTQAESLLDELAGFEAPDSESYARWYEKSQFT